MTQAADEARIVWRPEAGTLRDAHLTAVLRENGVESYAELLRLLESDAASDAFYERLIARLDLEWERPWTRLRDDSRGLAFTRWFIDARFNATANALDRHVARGRGDEAALIAEREDGSSRTLSFRELRDEVRRFAGALRGIGVQAGDRVGISLPMTAEAAIALLAVGYLGAIAVPAFSGYGAEALAGRLRDAGASVLIAGDALSRRGKPLETTATLCDAAREVPSLRRIVAVAYDAAASLDPLRAAIVEATDGRVAVDDARSLLSEAAPLEGPVSTAADDVQLLLFTSGSTGKPKGVVHGHAGFALKAAMDQHLCFDLRPGERMLWYTDLGWMMGPWLILGALMLGATVVLYDGALDHPAPDRIWRVCERHRVTHLGLAPTAVRLLASKGDGYPRGCDLSSLRILGSTGEPWNTAPYLWFLEHAGGGRCPIINYSGGTEIGGGILGCFPTMPLGPNAFHGPVPGMRADVVDAEGRSLRGGVGELALRASWPGMTQSLWSGDAARDDARYLDAYWRRFEGVWSHGDWAEVETIDDDEGRRALWYIRGRSDDTVNVAGKRVGPAEFESALASDPAVREAVAIGVPDALKGDVVVCLVVLRERIDETPETRTRLADRVEHALGHALRPKAIRFVDELPKTRNAKIMRRVARARYLGLADLGDLSGLENHGSLAAIDEAR